MPEIDGHRGQHDVNALVAEDVDSIDEIVFVVAVHTGHARVIVRDTVLGEHLHAFPLQFLLRIGRTGLLKKAVESLPNPRAF